MWEAIRRCAITERGRMSFLRFTGDSMNVRSAGENALNTSHVICLGTHFHQIEKRRDSFTRTGQGGRLL